MKQLPVGIAYKATGEKILFQTQSLEFKEDYFIGKNWSPLEFAQNPNFFLFPL